MSLRNKDFGQRLQDAILTPNSQGWPSGHTNLPCPCFKSSCTRRDMKHPVHFADITWAHGWAIFVLVLALIDQHALLSVPHLQKDSRHLRPRPSAGYWNSPVGTKTSQGDHLASSRKATVLELSFIDTSVAPGLSPLSILRISLIERTTPRGRRKQ